MVSPKPDNDSNSNGRPQFFGGNGLGLKLRFYSFLCVSGFCLCVPCVVCVSVCCVLCCVWACFCCVLSVCVHCVNVVHCRVWLYALVQWILRMRDQRGPLSESIEEVFALAQRQETYSTTRLGAPVGLAHRESPSGHNYLYQLSARLEPAESWTGEAPLAVAMVGCSTGSLRSRGIQQVQEMFSVSSFTWTLSMMLSLLHVHSVAFDHLLSSSRRIKPLLKLRILLPRRAHTASERALTGLSGRSRWPQKMAAQGAPGGGRGKAEGRPQVNEIN